MKIKELSAENFGSYKMLDLNLSDLGLTSISGLTGSGKSTIPDVISWILFGETSKDGSADSIRSWGSEELTRGGLVLELPEGDVHVVRMRGKSASQNDLWYGFMNDGSKPIRGKNTIETQQLINELIGMNAEFFFTTAYFHQFSKAESFFVSKPSERRDIFEKIVDQSMAIHLGDKTSQTRKVVKSDIEQRKLDIQRHEGKLDSSNTHLRNLRNRNRDWHLNNVIEIDQLTKKFNDFQADLAKQLSECAERIADLEHKMLDPHALSVDREALKSQIETLEDAEREQVKLSDALRTTKTTYAHNDQERRRLEGLSKDECPTCLGPTDNDNRHNKIHHLQCENIKLSDQMADLHSNITALDEVVQQKSTLALDLMDLEFKITENAETIASHERAISQFNTLEKQENKYAEQIDFLKAQESPFLEQIGDLLNDILPIQIFIVNNERILSEQRDKLASLDLLYDLSYELRGALLSRVINQIESSTNSYLEKYFDSEIKVRFDLKEADKLEVEVQKNGNICHFKSLSGGQRCLLKLAFWLAVKEVAENKAGVESSVVILDEALNGLDDSLKEKAFGLLQELEDKHDTVLVIDHGENSAIKSLFTSEIRVSLIGDESTLEYAR